jgi:hypothetical protein
MKKTIDEKAPYGVFDLHTNRVVYRTTYKHRLRARRFADKKDTEYGGYRFQARVLFSDGGAK